MVDFNQEQLHRSNSESKAMRYVFIVLLRATPAWLRLTRERRRASSAENLTPLLAGQPALKPLSAVRTRLTERHSAPG